MTTPISAKTVYPIILAGALEDEHSSPGEVLAVDGTFMGHSYENSYAHAVQEANRLVVAGEWNRVYIMVPSDYCCEMVDGKPTMVKHHLGEE